MATAIPTTFGEGGSGLTPGGNGDPTLASALRDAADDLAALKGANVTDGAAPALTTMAGAGVTGDALPAFTDPPTAGEMAALRTLVNEQRTIINALNARVEDLAAQSVANRLLANAFRTIQRARAALTMGLTKA